MCMSGRILGDTMARRSFGVAAVHSFNSLLPHCSRELLRLAPNMSLVVAFSNSYRLHTAKRAREGFDGHVRRGHERGAPVRSLPSDSLNASFEKGRGFNGRGPAVTPVGKFRFFLRGGARWTSSETRSFSGDRRVSPGPRTSTCVEATAPFGKFGVKAGSLSTRRRGAHFIPA